MFTAKDTVKEYERKNLALPQFLTISPNLALLQLPNENLNVYIYLFSKVSSPLNK